jgi:hypothetical protein
MKCRTACAITAVLLTATAGVPRPASAQAVDNQNATKTVALRKQCSTVPAASRMQCYDSGLLAILHDQGVAAAMNSLEELSTSDADIRREGHMYAQSIGLAAFTSPETVSAIFRQCPPTFQSGCYHGVIQSLFTNITDAGGVQALTPDRINAVCADYRNTPADAWILFQCVHGMGHGLSQVTNHELRKTLAYCDALQSVIDAEGCYGGAFMENVMEAFTPHHAMGRPDDKHDMSAMDHDMTAMDHDMAAMDHDMPASGAKPKLVDPNDPLYPCSALPDQYLHACYMMQTSVILNFNHGNIPEAAKTCATVVEKYRAVCYQSLGRDVSSYVQQDFHRAAQLCSKAQSGYEQWCHSGFVKNVIDVTARYQPGIDYCRSIEGDVNKAGCYTAVGEELTVLVAAPEQRAAACNAAEPEYRTTCATAAQVNRPIPQGILVRPDNS